MRETTVSQPDLTSPAAPPGRSVVVQRPKSDVYTVMLGIALLAVVIACVLLWLEFRRYKGDINATSAKSVAAVHVDFPTGASRLT